MKVSFFFLPYLIIPLFFVIKKKDIKQLKLQCLALFIISVVTMIIIYNNKGTEMHTVAVCKSLGEYVPAKCEWWGPIFALSLNLGEDWSRTFNSQWLFSYIHDDYNAYFGFLFYVVYSLAPLYFFNKFYTLKKNEFLINKKKILYMMLFGFIFSLPLYHLAQDWSRWFSIHLHLTAFLIFFLQGLKLITFENSSTLNILNKKYVISSLSKYFLIFLFLYATALHHHHFFFKGVKLKFTYYKVVKKIINNY